MPCEEYQDALIDLAAANAKPAGNVREHLAGCDLCRADLEQQRLLFACIDSGIRPTVNAPLPPALVQRFQARLAQQTPPKPLLYPSWMYAGIAFAAAALLWLALPGLRMPGAGPQGVVSVARRQAADRQAEKVALPAAPRPVRAPSKSASRPPNRSEPEVLVPPDERIAFERFLSDLNGRADLAVALLKPMQEQRQPRTAPVATPVPVEVPDLETMALTVQPLSEIADR